MGKIYKGQTDLTIKLKTDKDITGATNVYIQYRDPKGVVDSFVAEISDAKEGIIQYHIENAGQLNVSGVWTFWAKIVDANGLISYGEPSEYRVDKLGY